MRNKRKRFLAEFKAKVALAAVRGDRTSAQLATSFGVHANQVSSWKKQLVEGASAEFTGERPANDAEREDREAELYAQIGKLQVELNWLKKKVADHG